MGIRAKFTDHPASVGETYGEHFLVATHFAAELAKASFACAVHAFYPNACTTTASGKVRALYAEMNSGARGDLAAPEGVAVLPSAALDGPSASNVG